MLSTSLSHWLWVTLCHSWCKNSSSSALFDGLWPSIVLRVGEHCQSRRKHIFFQDNLAGGLSHASYTKTNLPDSSLAEASPDHHRFSSKFYTGCNTLWLVRLRLTIRRPGVGQSWKFDSEKLTLLQSSMVQSLWSFANFSLALLWLSLMKGFFLALYDLSPASRSRFRTVLAVHFTPAAFCHSFCRSLDVILRLLTDIRISWRSSWSVESRFCPLPVWSFVVPKVCCLTLFLWTAVLEILRMEATWRSLYPSASKARFAPFFPHSKLFFSTVLAWSVVFFVFQLLLSYF